MPINSVLYFHPEGFSTSADKLMGRHAAGEGFLRGWVRHSGVEALVCCGEYQNHAQHLAGMAKGFGWNGPMHWIDVGRPRLLAEVGNLFVPGPGLDSWAWTRRGASGQRDYSIVGVTHTTASAAAMDNIGKLLTSPVQEWDALICTSTAVRAMVIDLLTSQAEFLSSRLGVPPSHKFVVPQLPVIPLGVDTGAFDEDAAARDAWRRELGIGEQDCVVLYMGRLSFHAKAHPVPMYMALQAARDALPAGARLHLIEAGWFANANVEAAYASVAATHCPDVVRHVLDGRVGRVRQSIWQAADIFCSLSDNIQETFGLTPVEAMAAGLPCVVSDWDGYKETVRHGIDGFRVRTWLPPASTGTDLAHRHAMHIDNYDHYCGKTCQFVAVDPAGATDAFRALIADPALRHRMGQAARVRARGVFDWQVVIGQYQALFAELRQRREATRESAPLLPDRPYWPLRPDPFRAFAGYPSQPLTPDCLVQPVPGADAGKLAAICADPMVRYAKETLPPPELLERMLVHLATQGACLLGQLIQLFDEGNARIHAWRGVVFLAKYGLVALAPPSVPEEDR